MAICVSSLDALGNLDSRLARFVQVDSSGCWLWTGYRLPSGYGMEPAGRGRTTAHRAVYEALKGPIPDGFELDHVRDRGCTHRNCVNPDHLEAVTHQENVDRARISHCVNGHLYDAENTYVDPRNRRRCRECKRQSRVEQSGSSSGS